MNLSKRFGLLLLGACVLFLIYNSFNYDDVDSEKILRADRSDLIGRVQRLENLVDLENRQLEAIQGNYDKLIWANRLLYKNKYTVYNQSIRSENACSKPIAVLIFVCNRASAIKSQLTKLLKYRTSKTLFPIVVSQDCDDQAVANVVKGFGSEVEYIKHESGEKAKVKIPSSHNRYKPYYLISRHYKLGLNYIFDERKFDSVIIVEDDLDVSPDFYEYFCGTRWLLDADPSLFCISAWNDNGRASLIDLTANKKLYRSDFFPGLGWLMTKNLWTELGPQWPIGFWDDWIRDPLRRKNRSCIRPEISRTAMTLFGKKGASMGLFFNYYLKKIVLNNVNVKFTEMDQSYLLKSNYDKVFIQDVYQLPSISIDDFLKIAGPGAEFRIEYTSMAEYTTIAKTLKLMADTKTLSSNQTFGPNHNHVEFVHSYKYFLGTCLWSLFLKHSR